MRPVPWVVLRLAVLVTLAGCVSTAEEFDAIAAAAGLRRSEVEGAGFRHAVFTNGAPPDGTLRIYLDGDGTLYVGRAIAADPTPRRSLALALLAEDRRPALYLGRPCYHGEIETSSCTADLWTRSRYGEVVVASLAAAAKRLIDATQASAVTWVGHSGGGTLAMLTAPRVPQSRAVVTIAANLNVAAWARYVREDLSKGLDPAMAPSLTPGIRQYHYAGSNDEVVPPWITSAAVHSAADTLTIVDGFDHVCCWVGVWPHILARVDDLDSGRRSAAPLPIVQGD